MQGMRISRLSVSGGCGILHAYREFMQGGTVQLNNALPQLALEAGQVVSLDDAVGTRIHARLGSVWITEEGSVKDHLLGPGEAFTVAHDGRTVVQAMKASWITIAPGETAANDSE